MLPSSPLQVKTKSRANRRFLEDLATDAALQQAHSEFMEKVIVGEEMKECTDTDYEFDDDSDDQEHCTRRFTFLCR